MRDDCLVDFTGDKTKRYKLLCFPCACGSAMLYFQFRNYIDENVSVLAANLPGHGGNGEVPDSIEGFARDYIELIQQDVDSNYFILGYSFGGYIAYEIARALDKKAGNLKGVIITASTPPDAKFVLENIKYSTEKERLLELGKYFNLQSLSEKEIEHYKALMEIDINALINYQFSEFKLDAPALVCYGENEERKEYHELKGSWGKQFNDIVFKSLPGSHMLITTHCKDFANEVMNFINSNILSITPN